MVISILFFCTGCVDVDPPPSAYTLTIQHWDMGTVSISPMPGGGISTSSTEVSALYAAGTTVYVTISPNQGIAYTGVVWNDESGIEGDNPFQIKMDRNRNGNVLFQFFGRP
jgi:hypothetical protein